MNLKKIRILRNRLEGEVIVDFDINQGCCYFHNNKEFSQFTDIDDDFIDDNNF
ncbi:MAG: hypothetical protein ACFFBP_08300 [Promethearchaeota archaeon]